MADSLKICVYHLGTIELDVSVQKPGGSNIVKLVYNVCFELEEF